MIQDIAPKSLHNQYHDCQPEPVDTVLYFRGAKLLAKQNQDELKLPVRNQYPDDNTYNYRYLLSVDDKKYFIALENAPLIKADDTSVPIDGYEFMPVNTFRTTRPKETAFAVITGYHLYMWYRDNYFCGRCGKPMVPDTKERMMHCECCNNMVYPKICPAVIVAVTDHDRILLTKYAGRSYTNYALIAGFAEIGETIEQTVQREVMEEVGLKVKNIRYYKSQPWALSGSVLMGYFCELDGSDQIVLQEDELALGEWVKADEMNIEPDDISLTNEMMMKFKREHIVSK